MSEILVPRSNESGQEYGPSQTPDEAVKTIQPSFDDEQHKLLTETWKGWAELENDPLIFTQLLREWGVSDVKVEEVIPLETIFEKSPSSVIGLIFLSRWTAADNDDSLVESPEGLWFANQISTFSCATLALMNIINNRKDLDLGRELAEFKSSTVNLTPKERGTAVDDFQYIKDVHNSFARVLDPMIVDLRLKEEVQAAKKKRRPRKRKWKKRKKITFDDEENGFHFIAYVTNGGSVWKLDGLKAQPRRLGEEGDNWLFTTIADIQQQIDADETGGMECSLLSLTHESGASMSATDEAKVLRMKEDWSPFISTMLRLHSEKGDIEALIQ